MSTGNSNNTRDDNSSTTRKRRRAHRSPSGGETSDRATRRRKQHVQDQTNAELTELERLQRENERLQDENERLRDERNEVLSTVLAPSSVTASNYKMAGGDLKINGRDMGVARHPLFLAAVKCMQSLETPPEQTTEHQSWTRSWQDKAKYFSDAMMLENKYLEATHQETFKTVFNELLTNASSPDCEQHWSRLMNAITYATRKKSAEVYYSEELAGALTCFCNKSRLSLVFSHQFPCPTTKGTTGRLDIVASRIRDGADENQCSRSLLAPIETKRDDLSDAHWPLCAYLSELHEALCISNRRNVSFGLTIDKRTVRLYGFLCTERKVLDFSLLVECSIGGTPEFDACLKTYFLSLFALAGLQSGVKDSAFCPGITGISVKKKAFKLFAGVQSEKTYAYKVFDYPYIHGTRCTSSRQPNEEWIKVVHPDLSNEVNVTLVPGCSSVKVLQMPWFEGSHSPKRLEHITMLCRQLERLHAKGKCHGDVLQQNIVFGDETRLIDFDFAHLKVYPLNFNTQFVERHPGACGARAFEKIHDIYAVIVILCMYFKDKRKSKGPLWKHFFDCDPFGQGEKAYLLESWTDEDGTIQSVFNWIETRKNVLVPNKKPVAKLHRLS